MTNCYNIEMARVTQCDGNEETKRSYLSKRRPISPSRIKLKYLAKQQQLQQQSLQQDPPQNESISYRRQSSQPNDSTSFYCNYSSESPSCTPSPRLCTAKSMEWGVLGDEHHGRYNNRFSQPNRQYQDDHRQSSIRGSISKAKSIDFLSFNQPDTQFSSSSLSSAQEELAGAVGSLMLSNHQKNKLSGSTFTVFGGDAANHGYDDGDSGILVNDSGQCSILSSDAQSVQQQQRDEIKTVYLRKSNFAGKSSFGLLISQIARTFDTDHNRFRVRHVLRNSEADLSGEIQVGDEIISVNDIPTIEMSFDQIQEKITNAKSVLRLVLQRGGKSLQGGGGAATGREIR